MQRWITYRSFRPEIPVIRQFAELGVDQVCIFPANCMCSLGVPYCPYPPSWIGPDNYDFSTVDQQIADVLTAMPEARLVCMIDLNTPIWWIRLLGLTANRADSFYDLGRVAASDAWRADTGAYLEAFLRHTEAHHAERIGAYLLAGGMTTEWFDASRGQESPSRRAAWREWNLAHGRPDPIDIPPASVREGCRHGALRDPVADALALDYWRFNHELIAETVIHYGRVAQGVLNHRVPLGCFFGYALELGTNRGLYEGHLEFGRVFSAAEYDWFVSPGSYMDRTIGGVGGFMLPLGSVRHHGKTFLHEIDHRTHTARTVTELGYAVPGHNQGWRNETETIAGLRREFAAAMVEDASLWWFDMFGSWFEGEAVLAAIGQMQAIAARLHDRVDEPAAEVAVIFDPDSMYYLDGSSPLHSELFGRARIGLHTMGAPHEIFAFDDLATLDLSRFKLVYFPALLNLTPAKRTLLERRVLVDGRTVVWGWRPAVITDGVHDEANCERWTGVPLTATGPVTVERPGWRSVFAPEPNLPAETLRELCLAAGVHVYSDAVEPLAASRHLLMLHTATGGPREILLPRPCGTVVELFGDRVVARDATRFTDVLPAPGTVLYLLAD